MYLKICHSIVVFNENTFFLFKVIVNTHNYIFIVLNNSNIIHVNFDKTSTGRGIREE
jgi:hypothetical protein